MFEQEIPEAQRFLDFLTNLKRFQILYPVVFTKVNVHWLYPLNKYLTEPGEVLRKIKY